MDESIKNKIITIESDVRQLKETPTQSVIDKTISIIMQKLKDRDKIIDLELQNISKSIKIDFNTMLREANAELEKKLESRIKEIMDQQQAKISWGLEVGRFVVVLVMFILSIKLAGPL